MSSNELTRRAVLSALGIGASATSPAATSPSACCISSDGRRSSCRNGAPTFVRSNASCNSASTVAASTPSSIIAAAATGAAARSASRRSMPAFTKGAAAIQIPPSDEPIVAVQGLTIFLVLKAFASGCTAMTGVEAIANGVQAFREPASKNAAKTLRWMAGILLFLFLGISFLAVAAGVQPTEETVISQLTRQLFGTSLLYYVISFATMGILVVAANTSYADFPSLSSFIATD